MQEITNNATDGGQGKHLQPFVLQPECPKCLNHYVDFKLYTADGVHLLTHPEKEYIEVTCGKCGHSWTMATADSGKPKVILEKKEFKSLEGEKRIIETPKDDAEEALEGIAKVDEKDEEFAVEDK